MLSIKYEAHYRGYLQISLLFVILELPRSGQSRITSGQLNMNIFGEKAKESRKEMRPWDMPEDEKEKTKGARESKLTILNAQQ